MMSAAAFILFVLGIIGLAMAAYYAVLCYPIVADQEHKPEFIRVDSDRKHLIPSDANHNDKSAPSAPETVPTDTPLSRPIRDNSSPKSTEECSYPIVPNANQSFNGEDSFGSCEVPMGAASNNVNQSILDEPDCATFLVKSQIQGKELQNNSEPSASYEMTPLLRGDDEDGLIVCQPSVRSKNTGEPIPASGSRHVVIPIQQSSEPDITDPVDLQNDAAKTPLQSTGDSHQNLYTSVEHVPSHIVLSMHQPISVPPEVNMSISHPPSHIVVTVAQPLNVPPLMVAPVYDEPPLEEQPTNTLQQQLNPIVAIPSKITSTPKIEVNSGDMKVDSKPINYGWHENLVPADVKANSDNDRPNVDETHKEVTQSVNTSVPVIVDQIFKVNSSDTTTKDSDKIGSPITSSNGSLQSSLAPKDDRSDDTETSEGEVTEYTFETAHILPSTKTVIENEISSLSEVKIIRYSSISESVMMEVDNSINVSTKVHVGHPSSGIVEAEHCDQSCSVSPDLTIPRQSPDGDSLKSLDGETGFIQANSAQGSPQKCKLHVTPATQSEV